MTTSFPALLHDLRDRERGRVLQNFCFRARTQHKNGAHHQDEHFTVHPNKYALSQVLFSRVPRDHSRKDLIFPPEAAPPTEDAADVGGPSEVSSHAQDSRLTKARRPYSCVRSSEVHGGQRAVRWRPLSRGLEPLARTRHA